MNERIRKILLEQIKEQYAPYPQYNGRFDDWQLLLIPEAIDFKGGPIAANTLVLGHMVKGLGWGNTFEFVACPDTRWQCYSLSSPALNMVKLIFLTEDLHVQAS